MGGLRELAGKTAVVTGGASGIGKGIARQLAAEGMKVVIADVERGALDAAAEEIGALGVATDVSSLDSVEGCCQSNANSSPLRRSYPKPKPSLGHDCPPLSQRGGASLLVYLAADEVALLAEVVVD